MIHYLDTSLLVAALTRKVRTRAVQCRLAEQESGSRAIIYRVVTELSAALSVKLPSKQLTALQRADALSPFDGSACAATTGGISWSKK